MTHHRILNSLLLVIVMFAACSKDRGPAPGTVDNGASPSPAASPAPQATPTPAPAPVAETPAPPPPPPPVVIPSGTVLTVRLQKSVGSKISNEGDRFRASLAEPIRVEGNVVGPTGSGVSGTVTEAHAAGRFKGGATLDLVADTLTIHGTTYHIRTGALAQQSKGKGKRTAGMIGGGAGGGALIGAIAGGGKGAAIGALVGGGAGTAGAGLTGNRDITLPAETALSFKMSAPLTLEADKTPTETVNHPPDSH
jgi:hypothetical protein